LAIVRAKVPSLATSQAFKVQAHALRFRYFESAGGSHLDPVEELLIKGLVMKCPHCHMEDVLVSTSSELRLLSFVFNTVSCPHCSAVFAVPKSKRPATVKKSKPAQQLPRQRYAA
jgi:hypothetical protein